MESPTGGTGSETRRRTHSHQGTKSQLPPRSGATEVAPRDPKSGRELEAMSATETVVPQTVQPKSATDISGTPQGTVMIREYVETVARFAYIWGWPLVNNLNRAAAMAAVPEPGRLGGIVPVSPPGYVSMLTDYIDEKERFVTCPNQDTVYGAGFQRLDSIPVIVQVPDFGDRFWLVGTA